MYQVYCNNTRSTPHDCHVSRDVSVSLRLARSGTKGTRTLRSSVGPYSPEGLLALLLFSKEGLESFGPPIPDIHGDQNIDGDSGGIAVLPSDNIS